MKKCKSIFVLTFLLFIASNVLAEGAPHITMGDVVLWLFLLIVYMLAVGANFWLLILLFLVQGKWIKYWLGISAILNLIMNGYLAYDRYRVRFEKPGFSISAEQIQSANQQYNWALICTLFAALSIWILFVRIWQDRRNKNGE